MEKYRTIRALPACVLVLVATLAQGDVKMPAIFGDHMVLQQDAELPVWGTADPGEVVTVKLGDKTNTAITRSDGKWRANFSPLATGTGPVPLTVSGKNTLKFEDVLVGEVWICSGQSNMEFEMLRAHDAATEIPAANDPQLRLFLVGRKTALFPATDVTGKWELTTPQSVAHFSAIGYFFGRDLRAKLKRPIGLIGTYWGGTPAEAWTSLSGLEQEPTLAHYVAASDKIRGVYAQAVLDYPAREAAYEAEKKTWDEKYEVESRKEVHDWDEAVKTAKAANLPPPPRPVGVVAAPRAPVPPDGGEHAPGNLFDGMVAPLIPYAIKGVIWYQGEANARAPVEYKTLFSRLIRDWREKWGQGDFPFLFVQLAGHTVPGPSWPLVRDSQRETLALPATGMASALDIGDSSNIHPADKLDVGLRLSLVAQTVAYGQKGVRSGPLYEAMKVEGSAVRVTFSETDGGLIIGQAPWVPPGMHALPGDHLLGFQIAGADEKWVPADAKIDGPTVVVSSPQVPQPVAVRYAWESDPECNLYSQEGMPASPFRTDDWKN